MRFMYLLDSPWRGDSNKYTKCMIHEKLLNSIRYSRLRRVHIKVLYNSKFDLTAEFLLTNSVVITRVLCSSKHFSLTITESTEESNESRIRPMMSNIHLVFDFKYNKLYSCSYHTMICNGRVCWPLSYFYSCRLYPPPCVSACHTLVYQY